MWKLCMMLKKIIAVHVDVLLHRRFAPLSHNENIQLNKIMNRQNSEDEVINKFNIPMTKTKFRC